MNYADGLCRSTSHVRFKLFSSPVMMGGSHSHLLSLTVPLDSLLLGQVSKCFRTLASEPCVDCVSCVSEQSGPESQAKHQCRQRKCRCCI